MKEIQSSIRAKAAFFRSLLALSALGGWTLAHAADLAPMTPREITLDQVLAEAFASNPELREAKARAEIVSASVGPSGSYDDPELTFEAMNYPVDTLSPGEYGMTGKQLALTQRIPFPGKRSLRSSATRSESKAEKERLRARMATLARDVKTAYYRLYLSHQKRNLLDEERAILHQLVSVTRDRYAVGRSTQAELLALQVEEAKLMDEGLKTETEINSMLGELNHLLGKTDHEAFHLGRPAAPRKPAFDWGRWSEKAISEEALAKNPELSAKAYETEASERRVTYAKLGYLPDFDFKVGYTFRRPSSGDRGVDFVSGMVGITLPIWALTKQSGEARMASAERARAEAAQDGMRAELFHRIHLAYAELTEADKRIKLYESGILPLVKQAVQAGKAAYLAQKMDFTALLSTIEKRYRAELAYDEALAQFGSKAAEIEALIGGSTEVPNP